MDREQQLTIVELLEHHRVIGLDSNVLIYLLEGEGREADVAEAVLDALDMSLGVGIIATAALTEVLTRPASLGDAAGVERYAELIRSIPNVRIVSLDDEIAIDAAWGRASDRDLGDAIHLATARRAGATCFLTNDRRIRSRAGVEVVILGDLAA